ncbi:hypothetical protein DYU05_07310 [Mucilaginibacter terrenus]|uniref:GAPS4 PD-(D/E)XK nuclease domain-containing protein n=1 Tax=Mucilaginibacter terrenus TaxID=2482727 RepID=A0A3E2NWQ6_9SPHI|nr:hypothetical protein [Mucilaginibacter terrenus]RFZ85397.1 hypothetical protein DYU05_07310 [Mucilaginibacter terrenus]
MGELSKKIGEFGEQVVDDFLQEIGWVQAQKGIQLNNIFKDKYNKTTYGIDFLVSYECPLVDNSIKNILVSVKYHKDKYPDNLKSLAKSHLIELSEMMHSFDFSNEKSAADEMLVGNIVEDIGLLIWLCHKDSKIDLRSELSNIRVDLPFERTKIILLDNTQVDFLLSSITFIKTVFDKDGFEFYYPNTGQNINPLTKINSGLVLPIEFISSAILPFKTTDSNNVITLSIVSGENFSNSSLRRIIGLAQDLSTNLTNQILLAFPDYDELEHLNDFNKVKGEFSNNNFVKKIYVANYNNNRFRIK